MKAGERTVVTMDYTLKYPDGELIESSADSGNPLEFVYGKGQVLPAIEAAILGKESGDSVTVNVSAAEAYGPWNEENLCSMPRTEFPPDTELEEGMMLVMEAENGASVPFTVVKIEGDQVSVDFNHPLAGEDLCFELSLRDIREASLEELLEADKESAGCGCGSTCGPECGSGCK